MLRQPAPVPNPSLYSPALLRARGPRSPRCHCSRPAPTRIPTLTVASPSPSPTLALALTQVRCSSRPLSSRCSLDGLYERLCVLVWAPPPAQPDPSPPRVWPCPALAPALALAPTCARRRASPILGSHTLIRPASPSHRRCVAVGRGDRGHSTTRRLRRPLDAARCRTRAALVVCFGRRAPCHSAAAARCSTATSRRCRLKAVAVGQCM